MAYNKEYWNRTYQAGRWDFLFSPDELGHYLILLGYIVHVCRARRVLDAGCGAGRLLELLLPYSLDRYVGVDVSAEALTRCRKVAGERPGVELHLATMEGFSTDEHFDAVVFNESIYYLTDPLMMLERAAGWLSPDGALVLSVWRGGFRPDRPTPFRNHEEFWMAASRTFTVVQANAVTNQQGQTWDVRILGR